MSVETFFAIKAIVIGLATGLLSGGFGVGGGILCTPLIRMVLGESAHIAVGTTMALIIPTSIVAASNYLRHKQVDRDLAVKLAPAAVAGTVFGAWMTSITHGKVLMLAFAVVVLIAGIDLTFGLGARLSKRRQREEGASPDAGGTPSTQYGFSAVVLGAVAGIFAGFFGVGGGFIMVPCLLYFFRSGVKAAFGTSLVVVAAVSLPGTLTHAFHGHVSLPLALLMILGSLPGSLLGSAIALKLKESWLRRGFGVFMLIMALVLTIKEMQA